MPSVNCSPFGPKPQIELSTGLPAVGYKLFFYVAGSVNTKQDTYTDSTGSVANTNPVVLNGNGQPATELWFTQGLSYKVVLAPSTDTDPPTSPVWTVDNLLGINDTSASIDQWSASGLTPTFVSATQFTVPGDQTSTFQVGRRVKATVTAGTVYGTITVSAFTALTTVTVLLDSGALDSGLSAVSYGLLSSSNISIPNLSAAARVIVGVVGLTGNETVAGIKTFTSLPVLPATSPTGLQAASADAAFRKNAIINGDFQVWQEGTSFAAMADGQYIADNWRYNKVGAMVHTGSRSTDVPTIVQAGRKIPYSILIDCTTVDAAIAAGDLATVTTFVEGHNFVFIAGVGLCHQFWHKHTKTGTYCVAYQNSNRDRSFVREYTQAVSDTHELATVLVDASPTAGTWDYTTGIGLQVVFALAAGTDFHGAAGAWNSADDRATANQVNACDNVANNFMLTGVQLEKGSVATEFDVRTFTEERLLAQRYYVKTFPYDTAVAQNAGTAGTIGLASLNPSVRINFTWTFPVAMRTTPTTTYYNPSAANAQARDASGGLDCSATGNGVRGDSGVVISTVGNAGSTQGNTIVVHVTANARF